MVVYREDEKMLLRFQQELGPAAPHIAATRCLTLQKLAPSNHLLSPLWAQEAVTEVLMHYLADHLAISDFHAQTDLTARLNPPVR